jgi:hypothetical protein
MTAIMIIRTEVEIYDAAMRAQKAAFAAEDSGDMDDAAEAIYSFWQWMTGNRSDDPTAEMAEGLET